MFCKKCGRKIEEDSKFCPDCGTEINVIEKNETNNQYNTNNEYENLKNQPNPVQDYSQQNYNNEIDPRMKKFAIGSIAIPLLTFILMWIYEDMSLYLFLILIGIGFGFAQKGKQYNKTLSIIGYICNGVLLGLVLIGLLVALSEI